MTPNGMSINASVLPKIKRYNKSNFN